MRLPTLHAALATLPGASALPALAGNGVLTLDVHEKTTGTTMPAMVFHPARDVPADTVTPFGSYGVRAMPGAAMAEGRFPLVLISHGHGGGALGHHDLATTLADAGFIVASIEHAGDSYRDQSGFGTERVLLGRAWQVSALIDTLLADPRLAPHIDATRIGVAGLSARGGTPPLPPRPQPGFSPPPRRCREHPHDLRLPPPPRRRRRPPARWG